MARVRSEIAQVKVRVNWDRDGSGLMFRSRLGELESLILFIETCGIASTQFFDPTSLLDLSLF